MSRQDYDVIIIGAGASGFFCALSALQRKRRVAVLEHRRQALSKVSVSGGGNCNFTNLRASASNYCCADPDFPATALKKYSPQQLLAFLQKNGLRYYAKTPGRLFCRDGSQALIQILHRHTAGADFYHDCSLKKLDKAEDLFQLDTSAGKFSCRSLVVATGGLSFPQLGADDLGYRIAKQFGLKIIPPRPALVPWELSPDWRQKLAPLKGISLPVVITCTNRSVQDDLLLTHFGLSGPAVLRSSLFWQPGMPIEINLLPSQNCEEMLIAARKEGSRKKAATLLKAHLPERLVDFLTAEETRFLAETSTAAIKKLAASIHHWQLTPLRTTGFKSAEVTAGGVDTAAVSPQSFACKNIPGLYFVGEVLDVTGDLGGYNLQWAFSSGYCAGLYV